MRCMFRVKEGAVASRAVSPPRGYLAMSGDTFVCHNWGEGAMGIELEARGAADHPPGHTGAPPTNTIVPDAEVTRQPVEGEGFLNEKTRREVWGQGYDLESVAALLHLG